MVLKRELGDEFTVESAIARNVGSAESVTTIERRGTLPRETPWIGRLDLKEFAHIVCTNSETAWWVQALIPPHASTKVMVANKSDGGIPDPPSDRAMYPSWYNSLEKALVWVVAKIRNES
ncbi:MAG: hypothetical protein WCW36_00935 [Candidatus Paceibacterota bacterium]|jgi:hypothetical protein